MHWLILGNGTAHRKPTGVQSHRIDNTTLTLLALLCARHESVVQQLWRELWETCPSYEALPPGSKELVPMAASHLQGLGYRLDALPFPPDLSSPVLLGKCKAIWTRNALVMRKAEHWSCLLRGAGVAAVAIKGVASIQLDRVLARGRQSLDVDLMVPQQQWDLAEHTLKRCGEFSDYTAPQQWCPGRGWVHVHAQHWRSKTMDLDLHRHPQPGFLEDLAAFEPSQEPVLQRNGILIPNLADHMAIVLLHAFSEANVASGACFRYLAEALRTMAVTGQDLQPATVQQLKLHDHGTNIPKQLNRLAQTVHLKAGISNPQLAISGGPH